MRSTRISPDREPAGAGLAPIQGTHALYVIVTGGRLELASFTIR